MKIKDVIQEGVWDNVKSTFEPGAKLANSAVKNAVKKIPTAKDISDKSIDATIAGVGAVGQGIGNYAKSWGRVGNRLAKQFVGQDPKKDWYNDKSIPASSPASYMLDSDLKPNNEGEVFVVSANGQTYFKSYKGRWYQQVSNNPYDFSVTHPLDDHEDYRVLDKIVASGEYKQVPVEQDPNGTTKFTAVQRRRVSRTRGQR